MSIPTRNIIKIMILNLAKDNEIHSINELYEYIRSECQLTPEDMNIMNPGKYEEKYKNEIRWAKEDLKIQGKLIYPNKGQFRITELGLKRFMNSSIKLHPGNTLSNLELQKIFKCASQGGMRFSKKTDTLVLVSDHTKPIYSDYWNNNILYYTGMGRRGDQDINYSQNKRLSQSSSNGVNVHLFEVLEEGRYIYIGEVELAGEPYHDEQLDMEKKSRTVVVFPLKLKFNIEPVVISDDSFKKTDDKVRKEVEKLSTSDLEIRVKCPRKDVGRREVKTIRYERDPAITEYAKRRAEGICQLCDKIAPFNDKTGEPFLETHHINWLSLGGKDVIENTFALCPNCHRKMHSLDLAEDVKLLRSKVSK